MHFKEFVEKARSSPDSFLLIHYSAEGLNDREINGLSPRIVSIVVLQLSDDQTTSFTTHAISEELHIAKTEINDKHDTIERELLTRFFKFASQNAEKYWVHWNMRSLAYGFEHLEHRYRTLCADDIGDNPIKFRVDLGDIFKEKYGETYTEKPRLKDLMVLNAPVDSRFLEGEQEREAFKRHEYIRMYGSTVAKVEFFRRAIFLATDGRLRVRGRGIQYLMNRVLEHQMARAAALFASIISLPIAVYQIIQWFRF
jgi:hypothetical protein